MSKVVAVQHFFPDTDDITTPYGIAMQLFCGRIVRDRFNILNKYSKFDFVDTVDPIPEPKDTPVADLLDQRAQELISQGSIAAQWSGGVDSSTLLLALIKNGIKKDDLCILYDWHSKQEYPKLYDWLTEQGYFLLPVSDWRISLSNCSTDLITNGWCADQLFGSVFFYQGYDYYSWPIKDFLLNITLPNKTKLTEDQVELAVEIYQQMAKDLFGIELTTAAELGWFINFCLKWSYVSTFNELFLCRSANRNKTQVFYNTPEFQSWSLYNYSNLKTENIYKDPKYYKREFKEYCYSVFPDDDFLNNKGKYPSWNTSNNPTMGKNTKITVKTDKGYTIYTLKTLDVEKLTIHKKYYKKLE